VFKECHASCTFNIPYLDFDKNVICNWYRIICFFPIQLSILCRNNQALLPWLSLFFLNSLLYMSFMLYLFSFSICMKYLPERSSNQPKNKNKQNKTKKNKNKNKTKRNKKNNKTNKHKQNKGNKQKKNLIVLFIF